VNQENKVIVAQMRPRERAVWTPVKKNKRISKRLLRNTGIFAAVSLCIGLGAYGIVGHSQSVQSVMSHLTADFEYDESLGRLQFVSSLLPESAMVFLNADVSAEQMRMPANGQQTHVWTQEEPWIEYACIGDITSCGDGEVMTVVKNRQNEYTVRVMHDHGYESVYSGLSSVHVDEMDRVDAGEQLGTATGFAAFELRKEGLSVLPVFADEQVTVQ